ncbi:hypothetical protein SNE40_004472 [Patella caerulea]|uniref:Fibronectin type-III domain-containing protein n=1 Tax=Patella caerulea TaxID=87958 RepID=A0AAN8KBV5_PATCE
MENRHYLTTSVFIFLFLMIVSQTHGMLLDGNGVVKPDDPYVFFGHDLMLWCNLTNPRLRENSSSMYFKLNDVTIPQRYIRIINTKSIKLLYPITVDKFGCSQEIKRFNFVCLLNKSHGQEVLDHQLVQVNYEPKPVTDFTCRVYDWENMTCTWNLSTPYCNYDDIDVSLVWSVEGAQNDCLHLTRTSCSWKPSTDMLHPDMMYYMVVVVKNIKANKEAKSEIFKIDSSKIVQPAPVENFIVSRNGTNSTCLTASWTHRLKHRKREYKVEIEIQSDLIEEEQKMILFDDFKDNYTICGLLPHTLYKISVANKPTVRGFWSDTVEMAVKTAEDIPWGAPILCPGCFAEKSCEDINCGVQVYWKPVEKKLQNGIITGYKIEVLNQETGITSTSLVHGSLTSHHLQLPYGKTVEYLFTITAKTSRGFSRDASSIIIPSELKAPCKVEDLVVEVVKSTDVNQYQIRWSDDDNMHVLHYTLYYCKRSDITLDCRESISWQRLDPNKMEHILELKLDDVAHTWHQIGISKETKKDNIRRSSGIQWNECVYMKDSKPVSAPKNVRFTDLQPDRALLVEWDKLDCLHNAAYITGYLIHICQVANRNGGCTGDERNLTISNKLVKYQIEDLIPYALYEVTMQAVSNAGLGPKSPSISIHVSDNRLNNGEIAGIAIGSLFVIALIIFAVLRCIRFAKKEKRNCNKLTKIAIPELTTADTPIKQSCTSHVQSRPLPAPPFISSQGRTDSGYEGEDGQYEPVGSPQNSRKSITSKTILISHMEYQDECDNLNQLSPTETSPYAVTDVMCSPRSLNIRGDNLNESNVDNSEPCLDSYSKFGLDSAGGRDSGGGGDNGVIHPQNISVNNINPQTNHVVGFVSRNLPNCLPLDKSEFSKYKLHGPKTVSNLQTNPEITVTPQIIPPTQNSDSSEKSRDYVPLSDLQNSPIRANQPVVCELVSPSGDIHNTQTLLIRRRDPMRPLSDYMHNLPKQYFVEPNQDEPGPTTEL